MQRYTLLFLINLALVTFGLPKASDAQLTAPGNDWAALTEYLNSSQQDSIFVFFSSPTSPKKGTLKAKFSDGSASTFIWYRYNEAISQTDKFEPIDTIAGITESIKTDLERGGYRVKVTDSNDSTEMYAAWIFIDDVIITQIFTDNQCDFLWLEALIQPNRYDIQDNFSYWDISVMPNQQKDKYGKGYFKKITWDASNNEIDVPTVSSLNIAIEEPAPLYDASYSVQILNPFERVLNASTLMISAVSTKADFTIYTDKEGDDIWEEGGDAPQGEAPLRLKLESKSVNADSIYWNIINDEYLFKKGGDSILWSQAGLLDEINVVFPDEKKMVPGTFTVEHVAVKVISGCRDTMTIEVVVDSSAIKPEAIPNVFSPNEDGVNDVFILVDPEKNVTSIKSFNIYIFSRWGNMVYEYHGDPREWNGWNGKINGNRGNAPEGVYYYIIEAIGWDNRVFKGGKYKGFLHLFTGKK